MRVEVKSFYSRNKATMKYRDMLTLLAYTDQQMFTLNRYGVDTDIVEEFHAVLLRQYSDTIQVPNTCYCCTLFILETAY